MDVDFPFRDEDLEKGMVFGPEILARRTGKEPGTDEYSLACLKFRDEIRRRLEDFGNPMVVVCRKQCIKLLTDEEAKVEANRQQDAALWKLAVSVRSGSIIDVNNLDDAQQRELEFEQGRRGRMLLAAQTERRKRFPKPAEHKQLSERP